jgi:hypothetical protein
MYVKCPATVCVFAYFAQKRKRSAWGNFFVKVKRANILEWTLNTANDFRARLRFPRVAREPPDMNETFKKHILVMFLGNLN